MVVQQRHALRVVLSCLHLQGGEDLTSTYLSFHHVICAFFDIVDILMKTLIKRAIYYYCQVRQREFQDVKNQNHYGNGNFQRPGVMQKM
jgi:hypothetical protein